MVRFISQRFNNTPGDRQRRAAGRAQIFERGIAGSVDQLLQGLQFGFVFFLDKWRQTHTRHGLSLGTVFASTLLLLPQDTGCPFSCCLRGRPCLASQAVAASCIYRRGIGNAAAIDQVVARAGHIGDHLDRGLTRTTSVIAANPRNTVIATRCFSLLDSGHCIGTGHSLAKSHALCYLVPTELATSRLGHPFGHGATGEFGTVKVQAGL